MPHIKRDGGIIFCPTPSRTYAATSKNERSRDRSIYLITEYHHAAYCTTPTSTCSCADDLKGPVSFPSAIQPLSLRETGIVSPDPVFAGLSYPAKMSYP